jgi:tRNA A58 N-methylase Trm61
MRCRIVAVLRSDGRALHENLQSMSGNPDYVLQSERVELERLEHQARAFEPATRVHLQLSGIRPGMRVLDLGTGVGDVAFLIVDSVGPGGAQWRSFATTPNNSSGPAASS